MGSSSMKLDNKRAPYAAGPLRQASRLYIRVTPVGCFADDTSGENRIVVTIALFDSAILARIENMRLPRAAYQHWMAEAPRGGTVRVSLL
jgi:hypothetical protein